MGEYAHDAMRREIYGRHGFDIGEYDDATSKRNSGQVSKRVQCPHCDATPKERGLWQHVRDVHGITQAAPISSSMAKKT
jgi:hypothetical protein